MFFSGHGGLPASPVSPLQWHAHEMFFGFGWAILGGFLLTSTKNWVNIRGYHGPALMVLAAAWIVERLAMGFGGNWPLPLAMLANNAFLGTIAAMLLWTIARAINPTLVVESGTFRGFTTWVLRQSGAGFAPKPPPGI